MSLVSESKPCITNMRYLLEKNSLKRHFLEDSFYDRMRDTLTASKLKANAGFAKEIKEPSTYGKFESDIDFLRTIALFNESTLETRRRGIFFLRKVLPQLRFKENLLDVGSGDGKLTSWIGNSFKTVTMLDTNKEVVEHLNIDQKILRKSIQLNKNHGSILNVKLPDSFYDLTLLSHILYYLPREKWLDAINIAYKVTKKNGIVAIVLSGDKLGKAELTSYYGGKAIDIDHLEQECINNFGLDAVEVFSSKESIITVDLSAMLHIAGFCLYDAKVTASKESLTSYINKQFKIAENLFEMTSKQNFILIHKK